MPSGELELIKTSRKMVNSNSAIYNQDYGFDTGLAGKVVIVTGGTKGIGAACVKKFAGQGAVPLFHYGEILLAAPGQK